MPRDTRLPSYFGQMVAQLNGLLLSMETPGHADCLDSTSMQKLHKNRENKGNSMLLLISVIRLGNVYERNPSLMR